METAPSAAGTPIEPPAGFPVPWQRPEQAHMLWEHDAMHFPDQLLPLEEDIVALHIGGGLTAAAGAYELPIVQLATARINTWQYQSMVPFMGSPEAMRERGERAEAALRAAVARLGAMWEGEVLPEIEGHLDWWADADLEHCRRPSSPTT